MQIVSASLGARLLGAAASISASLCHVPLGFTSGARTVVDSRRPNRRPLGRPRGVGASAPQPVASGSANAGTTEVGLLITCVLPDGITSDVRRHCPGVVVDHGPIDDETKHYGAKNRNRPRTNVPATPLAPSPRDVPPLLITAAVDLGISEPPPRELASRPRVSGSLHGSTRADGQGGGHEEEEQANHQP